jgi:hypothetical protein
MPFVGDVFGLNSVYDRQSLNVEQRNLSNWPEYPTYGYFVGGTTVNAPTQSSTITRLDLATNTTGNPGKNLPVARVQIAAVSNNFYGYFGGGYLNTLVRIDFSNETLSLPGKNFTAVSRASQAAVSNSLYGFFGGGYAPGLASIISRLEFSSETVSNPGTNFSPSRARFAGASSNLYGYFGGGYTPTLVSTITRLDFSNGTLNLPTRNLPAGVGDHSAVSNISYGYFGGGTGVCLISRLDFSNETVSAPGKNLPSVRRGPLAFSSSPATSSLNGAYGYFGGGGVPTGSGITNVIDRLDYTNETISTLTATLLNQSRSGSAVANSGSSFRTSSKTYGYFVGGYSPTFSGNTCTIDRLDFSNESISALSNTLTIAKNRLASFSNNYYGYFGGQYSTNIDRLDFSNGTTAPSGKNLPQARINLGGSELGGLSNSNYGYFGGGYGTCKIDRLDFSSETISEPTTTMLNVCSSFGVVSNSIYGYFGGGYSNSVVTCSFKRLDFSTEIVSFTPTANFPLSKQKMGATSNSNYGYFGGGVTATNNISNMSRLDFSNETVGDPGSKLGSNRYWLAAVSSISYGYFGGGYRALPPLVIGYFSTVMRLDFSSDTTSTPTLTARLTAAKSELTAVSNSN